MKTLLLIAWMLIPGTTCPAAVIYPAAPEGGNETVIQSLSHCLVPFRAGRVEDLTISRPCQTFSVALTNLAAGKLVSAAHHGYGCDWEGLVMKGPKAKGLYFLWTDHGTGKVTNCLTVTDDAAGKWQAAIGVAEQLPSVKRRDYAIRLLDMGLPQFKAVWLHGSADDIFIPLYDDVGRLKALQACSEKELVRVWRPAARQCLKAPIPLD